MAADVLLNVQLRLFPILSVDSHGLEVFNLSLPALAFCDLGVTVGPMTTTQGLPRAMGWLLFLMVPLLFGSCGDDLSPHWREERQLAVQMLKWQAAAPKTYEIRVIKTCFCDRMGPVPLIYVDGDDPTGIRFDDQSDQLMSPKPNTLYSVPVLFQILEEAYQTADKVEVTFDDNYGYPRSIAIDPHSQATDDETSYQVNDFVVVTPR